MIKLSGVTGNIDGQESLLFVMRAQLDVIGETVVAEKLGITVEDLNNRLDHFSDFTLTELRFLASALDVVITYYVNLNGANPTATIENVTKMPKYEVVDERDPNCVEAWPECATFEYDPRCCRFPKSCSAGTTRLAEVDEK